MQAYGKKKIRHNYRDHSYRVLQGGENWWEDMSYGNKKGARQEAKEKIRKYDSKKSTL